MVVHHLIPLLVICSSPSHHHFHYLSFAVVISTSPLLSSWHITILDSTIPKARFSMRTQVFAEVLSMKAIPSCGDLH
jgi:hypothetical protein